MRIVEIERKEQLSEHMNAWAGLRQRVTDCSSVFLTPQWLFNWWDCFGEGGRLSALLAYEGERMVAMAPLAVFTRRFAGLPLRVLQFVGARHADHMDFCVDGARRGEAMQNIARHMVRGISWNVMRLEDLPEDSPNLPLLVDGLKENGIVHDLQPVIQCPYLPLNGDSWDAYYASKRSKSSRQDLRRRFRRLEKLGEACFRNYAEAESIEEVFPRLLEVYRKRWNGKNLSLSFTTEKERDFYRKVTMDFAADEKLHLLTLELDRQVIAFTLSARKDTQFTWLITAFDPEYNKFFPGEQILTRLLQDVFEGNGIREFDFTRGEEPYKFKWTAQKRLNLKLLARNRGFTTKLPYETMRLYASLRREAKKSELIRKIKLDLLGKAAGVAGRIRRKPEI